MTQFNFLRALGLFIVVNVLCLYVPEQSIDVCSKKKKKKFKKRSVNEL